MKRKKGWIMGIVVIAVIALLFVGYNIYRYPAMFRNLSDDSLNDSQVEDLREEILSQPDVDVLVSYFSYSGNTRNVATALREKTGGDLFEITPQNGYSNVYMQSNSEIRNNEKPVLSDTAENMDEYEIVFVGYPVWWHATPAPINTFLESYDLTGKLIVPFCTSGGSDIDETMPTFLNSCEGLAVYGERRARQLRGKPSKLRVRLSRVAGVLMAAYGVYALIHRDIPDYLFLQTPFVFFNFDEPIIFFYGDYIAIMGLMIWIGYYFSKLFMRLIKKKMG